MSQTHWKKLNNPDYIGAYSLEPGKDLILTINIVKNEIVTGPDNRKEECIVMTFMEKDVKPMIINVTNAKTISKLYKTPYVEEWSGRKIQLFATEVKAFGDVVECLRIRPKVPSQKVIETKCVDCGNDIKGFENKTAEQIAQYTYSKYSKAICTDCATKLKELGKVDDVL